MNKAELTAALAMRTKMSKADAGRAIEALFDDKGIIAGELKRGAKVQITGFGNFEARKRAARMGRNPKTGGVIQIKASIAPAFRAGTTRSSPAADHASGPPARTPARRRNRDRFPWRHVPPPAS